MTKSPKIFKTIAEIREEIEKYTQNGKKQFIFRGESRCKGDDNQDRKISSTLYRQQENIIQDLNKEDILRHLNIPAIQKEIIEKAKKHFPTNTNNLEILAELQHYGGKTNLIDFSYNFLVALFFACDGNIAKDGRLILLDTDKLKKAKDITENNQNQNLILESTSKNNRPIFQSSVFAYMQKGYIKSEDENIVIIKIPKADKQAILEELKCYYNITKDTIYNDLQGFIRNNENYKTALSYFYIALSYHKTNKN